MDVAGWLRGLDLGQYEANFRDNKINAALLTRLTNDDLKDMGVSALGDRILLLDAIALLAGAKSPSDVPASSLSPSHPKGPQVSAERRPITVMFCDLVGSTGLAAKLDPEDWRNLVNAYLDEASAAVTALGGHVLKRLGDGLMALFGYPQAQENDAERAVRAALAIQRALAEINAKNRGKGAPELLARIGIESGPVVVEATGEVFGDAPNVAARVQAAAEPGSVLVTLNIQRQVAGLFVAEEQGARELRGVVEPVQLFRVVRASGGGRRGSARTPTPFVGREEELALLARRWDSVRAGEGQLVVIVGEPGLGKSRLVEEFHARLAETPHTWVEWSASQLLQNTPLHPIAEWGRLRFGADAPVEQRLADLEGTLRLIGLDPVEHAPLLASLVDIPLPPARAANLPPEELRRRQLAAMTSWVLAGARSQPAVVVFEDLHWADPTSLDLLRGLAERGAQAPLLLLATARPEFRPPWSLRSHHSIVSLRPLDPAGVAQMVGEISARHALSRDVVEGVTERTGGVPLFVEEVTRLLLERGEQGGVQAIPPTLQQSLAARLDRLGPAREVAQIGAVLGRDFDYPLLRDIAEFDEPALQALLDRLAETDLLFVEGAPPQANYRFKHALIQDAAYDSLLKSRRRALHRRAAETQCSDPERATAAPEVIAHHFTEAGLDDLAIEWWGRAGDQALRRSAFQEAIAHLGKAIAMADKAEGAVAPGAGQRLKLQTDYGRAMTLLRGFASEESKAAFTRARELAARTDNRSERFAAYYGEWIGSIIRGDTRMARDAAAAFLREAEDEERPMEIAAARRCLGLSCFAQGDFVDARRCFDQALTDWDPERDADARFHFIHDTEAAAKISLALVVWHIGEIGRARQLMDEALRRTAELGHAPTTASVNVYRGLLETARGDAEATLNAGEILVRLGKEHGMELYLAVGELFSSWARGWLDDPNIGAIEYRNALKNYMDRGNKYFAPFNKGLLAELNARVGDLQSALSRVEEGLTLAQETEQHWSDAFLYRLRGQILLKQDARNSGEAAEAFQTAVAIAQQQSARSFGLRAALALAKLYQSTGRPIDAHSVLAPALEGFPAPSPVPFGRGTWDKGSVATDEPAGALTPDPSPEGGREDAINGEMPEFAEAHALLAALVETDEVRSAATHQQRQGQLQIAYGNALIAARGFGAPETTEAFARARESAHGEKGAPERLAAVFGLWAGSYSRGELLSMRAHAADFLADVQGKPDSPEAGVAHRVQGITHWFAGEFRLARDHLERALARFRPGRDEDLAYRFGLDPGVPAMAYLGFTLWILGEIDRGVSLIERARERVATLTHANTLALGTRGAAFFELMRGDHSRARRDASELVRIVREHDMRLFRAFGVFLEGWLAAERGALADGLEGMRRGAENLREQNALIFDGMIKILLSEAEARWGDVDRALAILDDALATAERLGFRAFESELHRVRGELLLTRDPANPAPPEKALQTAIAVAKQQGARSFELRVALSLGKLYQSIGRPVEARAILAPALEGFARTPEMPEIAEAQALLAAVA